MFTFLIMKKDQIYEWVKEQDEGNWLFNVTVDMV